MTAPDQGTGPAAELAAAMALGPDLVAIITHLASGSGEASPATAAAAAPGPAGPVKVRLSGDLADIGTVTDALAGRFEVAGRSGPRPNRYDPGQRVYLTICPRPVPSAEAERRA